MSNGSTSNGNGGSNGSDRPPTGAQLAIELVKIVEPLVTAFEQGPDGVARLLAETGLDDEMLSEDPQKVFDTIESDVKGPGESLTETILELAKEAAAAAESVEDLSDMDAIDWVAFLQFVEFQDLKSIAKSAKGIYQSVQALSTVRIETPGAETLADALLDYLLINYLEQYHGDFHALCCMLGVIIEGGGQEPDKLKLENLGDAFQNPLEQATTLFQWAKQENPFGVVFLLHYLKRAIRGAGMTATVSHVSDELLAAYAGASGPEELADDAIVHGNKQLGVPLLRIHPDKNSSLEVGGRLVPVPPEQNTKYHSGLALVMYGNLDSDLSAPAGSDWTVTSEASGKLANRGVRAQPTTEPSVEFTPLNFAGSKTDSPADQSIDTLVWELGLEYDAKPEEVLSVPLEAAVGRLVFRKFDLETTFEYAGGDFTVRTEAIGAARVVVDPQGGFLEEVIPEPIEYDFQVTVGWSSKSGFYFDSGGTLEVSLADNISLGPLAIKETYLGITPGGGSGGGRNGGGDGGIPITIGTTPALNLGFLNAQVRRIGLKADVSFPEDRSGNLGHVDIDIGFEPPNGLALGVDVGPVSGGGVINFFPDENRYSGALQLQINQYAITAVGLLKTELPGGGDGYSFLLLITAELPPIQLGFGFTLNGIGGLAGIHRSMKQQPLGKAVRTGSIDSVLFPKNVVQNAQRIISDLRSVFPPTRDQHVFGPMAKFAWGTPTMLTMEVGVVLQVPSIEIAILGAFHLNLPDESAGLISLNLAVVGYLDVPDKFLSIDASLYDSRIVGWTVSGDMAMRLRWGDNSKFMLSVGGFNARYDPPKKFPELDRITASLSPPGGQPRIEYKGYLAVTPNTFQVGASVSLHAEAGPAKVQGKIALDALFQFNPFKFIVDFLAQLSVEFKGKGLEIKVDGTISGPGPWRVKGKVHIDVLMFSVTARVDVSIGSGGGSEELPKAKVMPQLVEALGRPGNWAAQVPEGESSLVTLRQRQREGGGESHQNGAEDGGSSEVVAHPLGGISVRQTVVPLRERIEKFGNAVPSEYESFRIATMSVNEESVDGTGALREKFAPAKYRKMSDSEKMNSPAFVERTAGRSGGDGRLFFGGQVDASARVTAKLEYETTVIDTADNNYAVDLSSLGVFARRELRPEAARIGVDTGRLDQLLLQTAAAETAFTEGFAGSEPLMVGVGGAPAGEGVLADEASDEEAADAAGRTDGHLLESGAGVTTFDSEVTLSGGTTDD
jgi:hypothetical protein